MSKHSFLVVVFKSKSFWFKLVLVGFFLALVLNSCLNSYQPSEALILDLNNEQSKCAVYNLSDQTPTSLLKEPIITHYTGDDSLEHGNVIPLEDVSFQYPSDMSLVVDKIYVADWGFNKIKILNLCDKTAELFAGSSLLNTPDIVSANEPLDSYFQPHQLSVANPMSLSVVGEYVYFTLQYVNAIYRVKRDLSALTLDEIWLAGDRQDPNNSAETADASGNFAAGRLDLRNLKLGKYPNVYATNEYLYYFNATNNFIKRVSLNSIDYNTKQADLANVMFYLPSGFDSYYAITGQITKFYNDDLMFVMPHAHNVYKLEPNQMPDAGGVLNASILTGQSAPNSIDGPLATAGFKYTQGVAQLGDHTYVMQSEYNSDSYIGRVRVISPEGEVTTIFMDLVEGEQPDQHPQTGFTILLADNLRGVLYASDFLSSRIYKLTPQFDP